MDTIARVLESIPSDEIEEILGKTVRKLIHKKKFKRMIADGCYVVAVDGTQKWSMDWEFNAQALRKKHGNTTTYQVYVLEAALVGPQGIAIPLMSEFSVKVLLITANKRSRIANARRFIVSRCG